MRAVVDAKEFSGALDKVSKVSRKSKYIPVLEEVLVRFTNGRCVLAGTGLETWLTAEILAQGDDFAFIFHWTASVVKACRRFDGELTMELTETGEGRKRQLKLCMSCGDRSGEFHVFFPEEYPEMPKLEPECSFQVNASRLMERIGQIKYRQRHNLRRQRLLGRHPRGRSGGRFRDLQAFDRQARPDAAAHRVGERRRILLPGRLLRGDRQADGGHQRDLRGESRGDHSSDAQETDAVRIAAGIGAALPVDAADCACSSEQSHGR